MPLTKLAKIFLARMLMILTRFETFLSEETEIEREIFDLSKNNFGHLDVNRFKKAIRKKGLLIEDPRLADLKSNLEICQNYMLEHIEEDAPGSGPETA